MKDPTLEVSEAAKVQVDADLSTAGYTFTVKAAAKPGTALPYVRMTPILVEPLHNTTRDGANVYIQFDVIDTDYKRGLQIKDTVLQSLTDRSDMITTTTFNVISAELDFTPAVITEETPDGREYSFPIRIHYRTSEK